MSFGFAVSDFIAAGKLIKDIIAILRTSARSEYQELMLELHGLQRALYQIEHLEAPPEQQISIVSIKVAALMCTHVLNEFAGKLKKFESLAGQPGNSRLKMWTQKLRWGFTMADEVRNLRAYVSAHVGSLNMRLLTEGLSSTYATGQSVERTQTSLVKIHENIQTTSKITQSIQSTLEKIATVITSEVIPQLKTLVEQMARIWQSNVRVISLLVKIQESPTPALQYTWFQAPVKFEDALGRAFPIPSEFDWLKVEAIITAHFSTGPGHAKVAAGEYELFDPLESSEVISKSNFNGLRPGMSLTMAFIIGRYSHAFGGNERCPRPGCRSSDFTSTDSMKQCAKCNICFEDARTRLPLPYRDDTLDRSFESHDSSTRTVPSRKGIGTQDDNILGVHFYNIARRERICFKNIRLSHFTLPQTPPVANVRRSRKRNRQDPQGSIKKRRPIGSHWSPATIAKENHSKAHVENAIKSQRDNHGVEEKAKLMPSFSAHPHTKMNMNSVNYPSATYESGFQRPDIDSSKSSRLIGSNGIGLPLQLPSQIPYSSNRLDGKPLAFLESRASPVFSQYAPTVFSEAGISHDDDGRSVISTATMPAMKLQLSSHKPQSHKSVLDYKRFPEGTQVLSSRVKYEGAKISSLAALASTYRKQRRWKEAEHLEVQVMETRKKVLGEEHPDTLTSMTNLALMYRKRRRWVEAEELFIQVIETRKRILGEEHPSTLTSMAKLASTYRNQGRWKEAEELQAKELEIYLRVLGKEHPETLTSMANLASTYRNQCRWTEAEELFVQVMETRKRVLGEEHPSTLTSMCDLGSTYGNQGQWKKAEELEMQVIDTRKKILGEEHLDTLTSMANLASTYRSQCRWTEAEELFVQVIETGKRVLGEEHPFTLSSMGDLGSTYGNQDRWKEAEELEMQVMETSSRVLGRGHLDTLTSMANLASTYRNQGRWTEAGDLEVQVMETFKRILGEGHPFTLTSMANLAFTLQSQSRNEEAISLMRKCFQLQKQILGSQHPDTRFSLEALNEWQMGNIEKEL